MILDRVRTDDDAGSGVLISIETAHEITTTGADPQDSVFLVVFVPEHA